MTGHRGEGGRFGFRAYVDTVSKDSVLENAVISQTDEEVEA